MIGSKRLTVSAGLAALALAGVTLTSAPAQAATGTISCTGWSYTTYSPGLTGTVRPTTVTVAGRLNAVGPHSPTGSCLALGSSATSGTRDVTALLDVSCNAILTETGTETIVWDDGQSTSFTFTATAAHIASNTVLTETGTVTSGEFLGEKVVETFTAANLAFADCATGTGVTSLDYATVLTILPL
ncbi:hypothetical protein [Actinacidiphila bryophytorum]|uniref:hypothetical protein n=1 Tax=Actinacidiphila bryophytorum TaxID=1436133 RepID=UPI002176BB62|nr:hypothetical protein [Actinacidiphila bryophytorum]UWE11013.1 hypothetical protein NYE86_21380 [Actinacidiphila bryophytorum]